MGIKGKIVKKTTWGEKTQHDLPVRIIMEKLDKPTSPKMPYAVSKQVCHNKTIEQCNKESLENAYIIGDTWDLTKEEAEITFSQYVKRAKQYSNMKNIRVED